MRTIIVFCLLSLPLLSSPTHVYVANTGFAMDTTASVTVADWTTNSIVASVPIQGHPLFLAPSPSGSSVYVVSRAGNLFSSSRPYSLNVIDTTSNAVVSTVPLQLGTDDAVGVAATKDGKYVWIPTARGNLVIVDPASASIIENIAIARPSILDFKFSPDGRTAYFLTGGDRGVIALDTNYILVKNTFPLATQDAAPNLQISPDGRFLFIGPGPSQVMDSQSGQTLRSFSPGETRIFLTPDGKQLWTSTQAGQSYPADLIIMDSQSGNQLYNKPGDLGSDLQFTPDGRYDWKTEQQQVVVENVTTHASVATINVANGGAIAFLPYLIPSPVPHGSEQVPVGSAVSIVSRNSGKCLQASGNTGGQFTQSTCTANNQAQQFVLSPTPDNTGYEITAGSSGMQLDVYGGSTANGAAAIQWPYRGAKNQIWLLQLNSDGFYEISPESAPANCLDVQGESKANGAPALLWSCYQGLNQQWQLKLVGSK